MEIALFLQCVAWLICAICVLSRSTASIFHPSVFYLGFHFVVFVCRPLAVELLNLRGTWEYLEIDPPVETRVAALFISTIALVVFLAAVELAISASARRSARPRKITISWASLAKIYFLLGPLALFSAFVGYRGVDFTGSSGIEMERANGYAIHTNSTGYLTDASTLLIPLCLLLLVKTRFKLWSWLPIAALFGYRAILGTGRWTFVLGSVGLILCLVWQHRLRWPATRWMISFIPVLLLFWALGQNRDLVRNAVDRETGTAIVVETIDSAGVANPLDQPDFANYEFLVFVIQAVPGAAGGYSFFTQYLQLATEPIPRVLWPGKPIGPPIQLNDLNAAGNFYYMTPSLVGDGWMSLGLFGVIITFFVAGGIIGWLYSKFLKSARDEIFAMAYLMFLAITPNWFRDGGISVFKFTLFMVGPLALLWLFEVSRTRRRAFVEWGGSNGAAGMTG